MGDLYCQFKDTSDLNKTMQKLKLDKFCIGPFGTLVLDENERDQIKIDFVTYKNLGELIRDGKYNDYWRELIFG